MYFSFLLGKYRKKNGLFLIFYQASARKTMSCRKNLKNPRGNPYVFPIRCLGQKPPTALPADCSVLRTLTILSNIRISWDSHPTFMLISGRVPRSFTHL